MLRWLLLRMTWDFTVEVRIRVLHVVTSGWIQLGSNCRRGPLKATLSLNLGLDLMRDFDQMFLNVVHEKRGDALPCQQFQSWCIPCRGEKRSY